MGKLKQWVEFRDTVACGNGVVPIPVPSAVVEQENSNPGFTIL